VKIKFTPDGPESGWLPIEALHVGKGGMIIIWAKDGSMTIQDSNGAVIKFDAEGRVLK
jgi:hypothetical protein